MSKRKREAMNREAEIVAELCRLKKERSNVFRQNSSITEAKKEAQSLEMTIGGLELDLIKMRTIIGSDERKVHGRARVLIAHGNSEKKEVLVVIKNYSVPDSFSSDKYIVSQESQLACAIRETPVNGIAEYGRKGNVITLRVLEKCW